MNNTAKLAAVAAVALASNLGAMAQDSVAAATRPSVWTLQQCIDYAKSQNITIKQNQISAKQSEVDLKEAKAAWLPNLSFSTNQSVAYRPFQESSSVVNGSQVVRTSHNTSYSGNYNLSASMPLFDGGKISNNIKLQKINTQIAELTTRTSELNIEESITKLYVQILYAQETVKTDEEMLKLSQAQLDRANEMFKAGTLNKADVAQLESQTATDRYQLVADQTTVDNYKLQLKQLMELDGDEPLNLQASSVDGDAMAQLPSKADVYNAALITRPEIRSQQLAIDQGDLNVKIAKASRLPSINLNAGSNTLNMSSSGNFFTQLKNQWSNSLGVTLSIPILDRRSTQSAIDRAKLSQQTAMLELTNRQKELWKTIEGYWLDGTSAQNRYIAAQEKEKAARTSYELTSEQFRLGMKNIVELLTDKNSLTTATQQTLQAKYMAVLNAAMLKHYEGEQIQL